MPKYDQNVYGEIKQYITAKDYAERFLEPRGNNTYVCPCCDSGNGPNHTAAMHISGANGESWRCYSCNHGGDVFDLAAAYLGNASKQQALEEVARLVGYDLAPSRGGVDNGYKDRAPMRPAPARKPEPVGPTAEELAKAQSKEARVVFGLRRHIEDAEAVEYLQSRGISIGKAKEWGLGFNQRSHRIVIPWKGCKYYHIDRAVNDQPVKYLKPSSQKVGPEPLYNASALREADVVFIVEGPLDALAVADMGFEAIALNTSGSARAADRLAAENPTAKVVLLLDDDSSRTDGRNPGLEGRKEMAQRLTERGIRGCVCNAMSRLGVKDPFEAWQTCPDKLFGELDAMATRMRVWEPDARNAEKKRLGERKIEGSREERRAEEQGQAQPQEEKGVEGSARAMERELVQEQVREQPRGEAEKQGQAQASRDVLREAPLRRSALKSPPKPPLKVAAVEKATPDSDKMAVERSAAARAALTSSTPQRPAKP